MGVGLRLYPHRTTDAPEPGAPDAPGPLSRGLDDGAVASMIAAAYASWTYNVLVGLGILACVLVFIWEGRAEWRNVRDQDEFDNHRRHTLVRED